METIKDWLTSVRINYYESKLNLAWKPILKSIQVKQDGILCERHCGGLNKYMLCFYEPWSVTPPP